MALTRRRAQILVADGFLNVRRLFERERSLYAERAFSKKERIWRRWLVAESLRFQGAAGINAVSCSHFPDDKGTESPARLSLDCSFSIVAAISPMTRGLKAICRSRRLQDGAGLQPFPR